MRAGDCLTVGNNGDGRGTGRRFAAIAPHRGPLTSVLGRGIVAQVDRRGKKPAPQCDLPRIPPRIGQ